MRGTSTEQEKRPIQKVFLILLIAAAAALLAACSAGQGSSPEATTPAPTGDAGPQARVAASATATTTATAGPSVAAPSATEPASSPEPSATQIPPSSTPMPEPIDTPVPTRQPTSTTTPPDPVVLSFDVSPAIADPGDTVTLTWEAEGERARICPSARYVLFTEADCRPVPLAGSAAIEIPPEADGFQYVDFVLTVSAGDPEATATAQASVALRCERTWFFSGEPQAGICPLEAVQSKAAAQVFEHGTMIWLEQPGRYYVLQDAPLNGDALRHTLHVIADPLDITGDTSDLVEAPAGLYAPVSGFGLVWRGDVAQSAGFQEALGWALAPEFGYEAVLQCDNARPSGGRSWQTCYLRGPQGKVIVLDPLGGWYIQEVP